MENKSDIRSQDEKNFTTKDFEKGLGQAFNRKALAEKILELQPFYYDKGRNWWLWDWKTTSWERVDETDVLIAIEKQATINTINSKERNEMLEALKQVGRENKPVEVHETWVQFHKEVIDIKTGEKRRAIPEYFITNPIPWSLQEEGFYDTPVMDRIFEEWVGKEYVKTLYEIIAYCCLPDYPVNRVFCFVGSGLNGKSKFLELLRGFIGQKNCCSTELDRLLSSRFEITRLHKKLVCQMGETNFNEMANTSIIKSLSGGDLIGFEYKGKDPFEEKNYAKLIIATNNLPSTTDKSIGFYRRWMIIDFPNQFTEKKDILSEIPEEEYHHLANKVVLILKELLENRSFTNEGTIEERMERYENKSNFLEKFIKDFTTEEVDACITKADFKKKFTGWCKENRHREMSDTTLGLQMKKLGIQTSRRTFDWLNDGKSGRLMTWEGLSWK